MRKPVESVDSIRLDKVGLVLVDTGVATGVRPSLKRILTTAAQGRLIGIPQYFYVGNQQT